MTSWRVVRSISSMRPASRRSATGRTAAAVPSGTSPAASMASQAASSTSSHVRYFRRPFQSSSNASGV